MGRNKVLIASDGLPARKNGAYAKQKLEWLQSYLLAGLSVAAKKRDKVYVDLFAGPGLCVDPEAGEEFEGGALRAIQLAGRGSVGPVFSRAVLVDSDHTATTTLATRIDQRAQLLRIPRTHIEIRTADSNKVLPELLQGIHQAAWVFVFADITAPSQLPFSTLRELTYRGHRSVDLYVLFPLEMVIQRQNSFRADERLKYEAALDAFFGTTEWRDITAARITNALSDEWRERMVDLYVRQLGSLWNHAKQVLRVGADRTLYRMVFATSDPTAYKVAEHLERKATADDGPQLGLGL